MKLSVALAVHNEEHTITACLESIYDFADEIIIVDGKSTDKTVEKIKKLDTQNKIHVFEEEDVPMFHINKQKAIEKCKGEWILQLDADEIISTELKEEIHAVILIPATGGVKDLQDSSLSVQNDNIVAYWIPRLNYFLGKPLHKGGQYPDYTIRLYKNGVGKFACKSVHEQIEITIAGDPTGGRVKRGDRQDPRYTINYLTTDLLHYPYPTFEAYLDKWIRYSLLEAQTLFDQGVKPSFKNSLKYMIVYPKFWFFKTYFRHRGYTDGFPGFVFSLFSSLRYCVIYAKLWELHRA